MDILDPEMNLVDDEGEGEGEEEEEEEGGSIKAEDVEGGIKGSARSPSSLAAKQAAEMNEFALE